MPSPASALQALPPARLSNFSLYADRASRLMYPGEENTAKRDAARHMLASALAAQMLSPGVATVLGGAHEFKEAPLRTAGHWLGLTAPRGDYPVDMHNNALGVELWRRAMPLEELLRAVQSAVDSGGVELQPGRVSLRPDPDTRYDAKARGGLAQLKELRRHG